MKKILILIVVLATLQSCNKFGDTNVSPTLLTKASTSALLTNSQQAMKSVMFNNRLANLYVQHLSEGPYPGSSLYSDRNASFSGWYVGPLYDLQTIINYNNTGSPSTIGNGSKANQISAARILKAFYFLRMTDIWGDIPYSDALKGSTAYSPKYDTQESIYTDLFKELTEAVAQIKENESTLKIVLKTKNETEILDRWLEHHLKIAGDLNVIVFDNGSTNPKTFDIYKKYLYRILSPPPMNN
jgi:hypothetical protein